MFSIIIPIFNECENIEKLILEINNALPSSIIYEIIAVNDCSTDNTKNVLDKLNEKLTNLRILNNSSNKGQSFSIYKGIKNSHYNTVITIDGDGQNNPADIPMLLNIYINDNDIKLVGGIRKNRKDSLTKIFSSKIANHIRSRILNDKCSDTGCSLKVFDKKIFLSFPYFDGIHRFLPALFAGYGNNTFFKEVDHRKRLFGKSKYGTTKRLLRGIIDIIKVKKIINNVK